MYECPAEASRLAMKQDVYPRLHNLFLQSGYKTNRLFYQTRRNHVQLYPDRNPDNKMPDALLSGKTFPEKPDLSLATSPEQIVAPGDNLFPEQTGKDTFSRSLRYFPDETRLRFPFVRLGKTSYPVQNHAATTNKFVRFAGMYFPKRYQR